MNFNNEAKKIMLRAVDAYRTEILAAERHIWKNPESGYREWKTHRFLKEKYESLGYSLHEAGNIPGFYVDIDTGKPGPTVGIFGEMDSLIIPTHPECDPETGAVHACGHHAQSAALLGLAAALKAPHALDSLCGRIRLFVVPAEELIEFEYRESLRSNGTIRFFGGKQEFLYRGYLDGVDMAFMVHTTDGKTLFCNRGSNGCVIKKAIFRGKACHASAPSNGINALYAANCALNAANALRETFKEGETVRFHPIITYGGSAVNSIPDTVTVESYIRGRDFTAIGNINRKINLAFAGSAASIGGGLTFFDNPGYAPQYNDPNFWNVMAEASEDLFENKLCQTDEWGLGCSDMGDITSVMPGIHACIGGSKGTGHGSDYFIDDPELACVTSAKVQAATISLLLSDGAVRAKEIIALADVPFKSIREYFKAIDDLTFTGDAVSYGEDGTVTLRYQASSGC